MQNLEYFYGDPMKLRGLSALITLAVLAIILLIANYGQKSRKNLAVDDIKSQLTPTTTDKSLKTVIEKNLEKQNEMVERKDFDDTILSKERSYTESEINEMSEPVFIDLLKATEVNLPKLSDLKKLPPGALHHTPAPVMQAGKDLGLLKEILKVHESYEPVAMDFYQRCAKNTERPTSVRALCLTNLVEIKKKNGESVNLKEYPAQLVELTKMITDL